jgi:hypothetical protein
MKTRIFNVPQDSILEFAEIIGENDLEGIIIGTEDDSIAIAVDYEPEEHSEAILSMIEHVESIDGDPDEDDDND